MNRLALFDCDGTLFLSDDPLCQRAMVAALTECTGTHVDESALEALDHEARTARWIAREVIRRHELPNVDLDEWAERVEELYCEQLPADVDWDAPKGTHAALAELERDGVALALLTGVPKRIALDRMRRLGLSRFFPPDRGAFGSEVEERHDLIRLALERAGVEPEEAVHVGDTSRDVTCARRLGLDVIATAFDGAYARKAERADDAVRTMPDLVDAIRQLRS